MKRLLYMLRDLLRHVIGAAVGANRVTVNRLVREGRVTIGEHTLAYSIPRIEAFSHDTSKLFIGDYGSLSTGATVLVGGKHATNAVTTYPHRILWNMEGAGEDGFPMPTGDGFIGADVWLCDGVYVMPGLRIGHGAIIGAGSVVTKDIPDYAIAAGNPCQVIRYRFPEDQIAELLDIAWWEWPEADVRKAVPLLAGQDASAFIAYAREREKRLARPKVG